MSKVRFDTFDLGGGYRGYLCGSEVEGWCAEAWRGPVMSGEFVGTTGVMMFEESARNEVAGIAAMDAARRFEAWKRQRTGNRVCSV